MNQYVSHEDAAEALDSLDDYARMGTGVDAHGPRGVLKRYIAQQSATLRQNPERGVTEAMVERALIRYAMLKDQAVWPDAYSDDELEMERRDMRAALEAALSAEQGLGDDDAEARSHARMIHDFPKLSAFFGKHALGSKSPVSCFACGHVGERAITHAELVDIYVCKTCAEKITAISAQQGQGEAWPAPPWLPIDQLPESDDLFWFLRGDTVDGPRPPQFGGYDADEWDYFAPCVEPPAECTAPPAQPAERVPEVFIEQMDMLLADFGSPGRGREWEGGEP